MTDGPLWKVELHAHTCYSRDSLLRPEAFVAACRRKGIDRIAVTDHNTMAAVDRLRDLAPGMVIPGEEIMTTGGEILGYFMSKEIPPGLTPQETIERLREQGAVIGIAHPFDRLRGGAWDADALEEIVGLVDFVEVFNARCVFHGDNVRALQFAERHGLPGTAGSDAHTTYEIGRSVMLMEPFDGADGFLEALRQGRRVERATSPLIHLVTAFAKRAKKLGWGAASV